MQNILNDEYTIAENLLFSVFKALKYTFQSGISWYFSICIVIVVPKNTCGHGKNIKVHIFGQELMKPFNRIVGFFAIYIGLVLLFLTSFSKLVV